MYDIFGKPLKKAFRTCMGHGGGRLLPTKVIQPATGFFAPFQGFHRGFHPPRCWSTFQVFSLKPVQNLGSGPDQDLRWLLVGGRAPADGRLPRLTANWPIQQQTDSGHTVSPYFKGVESISGFGLPQFLGFGPCSRAKP